MLNCRSSAAVGWNLLMAVDTQTTRIGRMASTLCAVDSAAHFMAPVFKNEPSVLNVPVQHS